MRLGIAIDEVDPWGFFSEIYNDLTQHYKTNIFKHPTYHLPIFQTRLIISCFRNLGSFLRFNDVVFFEWASRLLVAATHLKKTCGIVTQLIATRCTNRAKNVNWDLVDKVILVSQAKQQEFIAKFPDQAKKTTVIAPLFH